MADKQKNRAIHLTPEIAKIIRSAKRLAKRYHRLTGRLLGITGEVAEYEAARLLNLELALAGQAGHDAIRKEEDGTSTRLQIKGRCCRSWNPGARVGKIDLTKEWDAVILVLLNADLEPVEIYEAKRSQLKAALTNTTARDRLKPAGLGGR